MPDTENSIVIYSYKYNFKNMVLTTDQDFSIRDGSVITFHMTHDYLKRKLPWIKMSIELDIPTIASIYKFQDKAKLKVDMYEYQYSSEETIVNTALYLQHTFSVVPAKDKNNYITSEDSTTEDVVDVMKNLQLFEMYLIDMDAVNWFNKQICTMFQDCSKPAAIMALMQMRGVPSGISVVTPPQDNNKIDYIIIPLGDLIGNIQLINKRYGIYDCDPIIYYDLDYLYCINRVEPNITMPLATDYGSIVIMLANPTSPAREIVGSCTDMTSKTHYINVKKSPQIYDYTNKITSTKFSTLTTVDANGNVKKSTVATQNTDGSTSLTDGSEETALNYIYAENEMTANQMINDNMEGPNIVVIVSNMAVSFLRPYKNITFSVGSQLLSLGIHDKEYRLYGWSLSITREGSSSIDANYIHEVQLSIGEPTITGMTVQNTQ